MKLGALVWPQYTDWQSLRDTGALVDGSVRGIAVHTGARVSAKAAVNEVLVSQTVKDLVSGSGIEFADRGTHALSGVPGQWRLHAVTRA